MKRLIVNADDFGFCEAVNYGIYRAFSSGIVSSTSIMANMPGFEHAVALAKQHPELPVGVHLNVTCYHPLLDTHQTLCQENGQFYKTTDAYDLEEVYQEFCAQIEKVQEAGLSITHLDSHHHVHTKESLRPVMERLLQRYPYPIRGGFKYPMDYEPKSELFGRFYQTNVSVSFLEEFFASMKEDVIYDMMCHPAYIEKFLNQMSSYALQRMEELDVLTASDSKELVAKYAVELTDYRAFQK